MKENLSKLSFTLPGIKISKNRNRKKKERKDAPREALEGLIMKSKVGC